ncbi:MAG: hypothetical protein R3C10_17385 [Pirellulales bacterium]
MPPYDPEATLATTDFAVGREANDVLRPADSPSRPKGWRVETVGADALAEGVNFGAWLTRDDQQSAERQAALGVRVSGGGAPLVIDAPLSLLLAQEVRSPFSGTYRFTIRACGDATSPEFYEQALASKFRCRLVFFRYTEASKRISDREEIASVEFSPVLCDPAEPAFAEHSLTHRFINDTPGGNFSFGLGLGVGIAVERTAQAPLELATSAADQHAALCIASVRLEHTGKEINPDVVV